MVMVNFKFGCLIPYQIDAIFPLEPLIDMGVDGIITNRPDILKAVLKPELIVNKVG
jgi:glycerophosphoryl diester phosphodiesterase